MAIHRGIQSAIFFYLSCAPCSEARIRKKRKQEAVWNRAERDLLEEENPDLYRHPEPSSTNPYWQNEISLGPAMNPNRRKGKNGRKSPREAVGVLSSRASTADMELHGNLQREDEELWGSTQTDGTGSVLVQRPQRARTRGRSNETSTTQGTTSTTAYQNFRSPPVSDLLPPIVRTVHSREEVAWMMQPPPVADFMSGKSGGVGISRSVSSRQGTARTLSRGSSSGAASSTMRDSPRTIPLDRRPSSRGETSDSTLPPSGLAPIRRIASRPPLLSTIASEEHVPTTIVNGNLTKVDSGSPSPGIQKSKTLPSEKARPRPRARSNSDSRPAVAGGGGKLKGRIFAANFKDSYSPPDSANSPEILSAEGEVLKPELFDSWYTPDFELGRWVHEHTRREGIRERWSFDY